MKEAFIFERPGAVFLITYSSLLETWGFAEISIERILCIPDYTLETLTAFKQSSEKRSLYSVRWQHSCVISTFVFGFRFFFAVGVIPASIRLSPRDRRSTWFLKCCLYVFASWKKTKNWGMERGSRERVREIFSGVKPTKIGLKWDEREVGGAAKNGWMIYKEIKYQICLRHGDGIQIENNECLERTNTEVGN